VADGVSGPSLAEVVEQGDLDQLVRTVDQLCATRDWDGLVELRDRCRWALERGKQLWPAASLAEYRLALEAPGQWAAGVLAEGAGRFALGPLPEVAASTHTWAELVPHLAPGPLAAITAHERVLRGEDLRDEDIDRRVLEVPLTLMSWEPKYPLAEYEEDKAAFPPPAPPALSPIELENGDVVDDRATTDALLALTTRWTVESNGRSEAVAVRGRAPAAISALGVRRARVAEITAADGLAWMAWAAASGGAHGRRRGMATGRFDAWWAAVALADSLDDWPLPPDEVGDSIAALRWFVWDAYEPETGWVVRLAVEDPDEGMAWAVAATDQA
jgi:hypothetical protein